MSCCASIGTFSVDQISARSGRTSAIALSGSSGALLANANVNSASTDSAAERRHGQRQLRLLQLRQHRLVGLARRRCRGFQSTSSARSASMHWPNVSPRTATP